MQRPITCFVIFSAILSLTACAQKSSLPPMKVEESQNLPAAKELPDPLTDQSGKRITSAAQWPERREEMKDLLAYYALGHAPEAPGNLIATIAKQQTLDGGKINFTLVTLTFGPQNALSMQVAVFVPTDGPAKHAVVINPSFYATPGDGAVPYPLTGKAAAEPRNLHVDPADVIKERADLLGRGYALITYNYQQTALDNPSYQSGAFFEAYPAQDWATLREWAWALSRVVDYAVTQSWADPHKIVAVGHSRLGKTILVAGAFDERIAVTIPAGSGCGGTGAYRINGATRGGKQGLEDATTRFPQWFSPRLKDFSNNVDRLPFDQNFLIALCAPRAILCEEAINDPYCNGKAAAVSYQNSLSTYAFLNALDKVGIHFRAEAKPAHALNNDDWQAILDFCDWQLFGKAPAEPFNTLPPAELLK